jgi:predicted  nucleic acid-binding Zn-ribbon protein
MGKVLRIFLILMLLAAIGALTLEYFMYQKRLELTKRATILRESVVRVSEKINAARDPYIQAIETGVDPAKLESTDTMGEQLGVLESNTVARYEQIYLTKDELKKTRDELTKTQQELAQTKQELDTARQEIATLNEKLTKKEAEIAQAQQKIGELENQVAELKRQVDDYNGQIAKLEDDKKNMIEEKKRLEDALAPFLPPPLPTKDQARGLNGHIVLVDPEWNFVVVDLGKLHGLQKNTQMLVHRGEELVGRIRVSDVRDQLSVGDVERAWVTAPLQPGDRVFIQ